MTLEPGQALAVAEDLHAGAILVRRGVHPVSGAKPEMLVAEATGELVTVIREKETVPGTAGQMRKKKRRRRAKPSPGATAVSAGAAGGLTGEWESLGAAGNGTTEVSSEVADHVAKPAEAFPDSFCHLVQDDQVVADLHDNQLPPDEYYDELRRALLERFEGADLGLVEHVVALCGAFGKTRRVVKKGDPRCCERSELRHVIKGPRSRPRPKGVNCNLAYISAGPLGATRLLACNTFKYAVSRRSRNGRWASAFRILPEKN